MNCAFVPTSDLPQTVQIVRHTTHLTIVKEYSSCCRMVLLHITAHFLYCLAHNSGILLTLRKEERHILFPVDQHCRNTPKRWFSYYCQTHSTQRVADKGANLNVTTLSSLKFGHATAAQVHTALLQPCACHYCDTAFNCRSTGCFSTGSPFILCTGSSLFINEGTIQHFGFSLLYNMQP